MQKLFYLLLTALSLVLLVQCNSDHKALNKKLNEMAADLNESAPVMLDQYTRFDGASVSTGNIFQYRYTVLNTTNPDSLVESGVQALQDNIRNEFSTNPQLRVFKENKVVIEYVYMDEHNRTVRSLQVNPEDYQ